MYLAGGLAARLAVGTLSEAVRRQIGTSKPPPSKTVDGRPAYSSVISDANAERLAETLCKMRGAALKLGQMLSIQDEGVLPEPLIKVRGIVLRGV